MFIPFFIPLFIFPPIKSLLSKYLNFLPNQLDGK
jgi:hypothetical protein